MSNENHASGIQNTSLRVEDSEDDITSKAQPALEHPQCQYGLTGGSNPTPLGIAVLPDDLLANIFDLIIQSGKRKERPERMLSHVCRRFRSVALATPSLWTDIRVTRQYQQSMRERNAVYLTRSSLSLLDIRYAVDSKRSISHNLRLLMKDFLPHSDRWRHFRVDLQGGKAGAVQFFKALERFGPMHLQSLEKLTVVTYFLLNSWYDDGMAPFSSWNLPRLRSLRIEDFTVKDLRRFPSLTELTLATFTNKFPFIKFFDSLESLHSLRRLNISLNNSQSMLRMAGVNLPSVLHLSLTVIVAHYTDHASFLSLFSCPNVTSLSLNLRWGDASRHNSLDASNSLMDQYLDFVLSDSSARYQHLSTLRIRTEIMQSVGNYAQDGFRFMFKQDVLAPKNLPSLRHLQLDATGIRRRDLSSQEEEEDYLPNLKTMTIRSTRPESQYEWLLKVIGAQDSRGIGKDFEQLVVIRENGLGKTQESTSIPGADVYGWIQSELTGAAASD